VYKGVGEHEIELADIRRHERRAHDIGASTVRACASNCSN
jgi:hypothetical protein